MWSLVDAASPGCNSRMLGQAPSEGEGHAAVLARWQMLGEAPGEGERHAVVLALRQKHKDAREALLSGADPSACAMDADSDAAGVSGGERQKSTVGVRVGSSQLGLVSMVLPGGPAYKKIKKGDVILSLDGTSVTAENLVPLLKGSDEVDSIVKVGIKGCPQPIEIRRGDIRLVQKIKDVFVSLSNAQQACKNLSSDRVELLKLVNLVEPAAIELVAWLHMVSDAKGRHIHDLEDAVVAQAHRGDANAARCKDLNEQLLDLRGQLAEATQRRDASEARCKDLEVQLQDLRGQLAEKRGDANAARCKDLEGQLQGLQGQLAEQRAALERAAAAQQKLTEEAAKARDAERRAATQCKDLEGQLQGLQGQLAEQRAALERAAAAQQKLTEEAAKARDAERRAATQCKDLEGQLQGLQGQLAEQRAALERAAAAQQKLTEEAAKARDAERRAATRCKDLEGQLQGLQGQLAEQRAALERAAAAQQKLTEEAAKARDAERRAATRCKDLEGQLQRARDAVTRTQASEKGSEKVSEPAATATKRKPTAEAAKARDADTECDVIILL